MHRKFAAAILLVIKTILLDNLNSALAQTTFAPVLRPKGDIRVSRSGKKARFLNLLQAFPTTRSQGGGDHREAMLFGIFRSPQKPILKTFQTSWASLGFLFQTFHFLQPLGVVIIGVNDLQSQRLRIARTFVLTDVILFTGIDIGIAIIDGGRDAMLHQALDDGRRTRRTASVEQHFGRSSRCLDFEWFFHKAKIAKKDKALLFL